MQKQYEIHPIANVFPMMSKDEFKALKSDIKEHGLREPIVFWKNMLVDGRNRLKACEELGIEADESELMDETDPVAWVISHNLHRRHLTESQRSMVAGKLANLQHGGDRKNDQETNLSLEKASSMLNVSKGSTKNAKKVLSEGVESVQQAVEQGELPVSVASDFVKAVPDKKEQKKIIDQGTDAVKKKVKESKTAAPKKTPVPKDVTKSESSVNEFLLVWEKASSTGKRAIWLWLCDNYEGAT
jgi:hypothetical protein